MRAHGSDTFDSGTLDRGSAERQLWCAVIDRAVQDARDRITTVSGPAERVKLREDARFWVQRNGTEFRTACDGAGYDPDFLRARILSLITGAR